MTPGRRRATTLRCSAQRVIAAARLLWWVQHPRSQPLPARPLRGLASALDVLARAPRLQVHLTDTPQGRWIAGHLGRRLLGVRYRLWAKSVLAIPTGPGSPFRGRRLQAARTNMRRARAQGMRCAPIDPPEGFPAAEAAAVFDAAGTQLGFAHLVVDTEWAVIASLQVRPAEALYLLHGHLVEQLQRRGVRWLFVCAPNAIALSPGLLYLQGRLDYQVVTLRLPRRPLRLNPASQPAIISVGPTEI